MAGKVQGPAIGIDLGTCYSCVAIWKHNRVEIIPNDLGNRKTPSFVAFNETHRLIGHAAMDQAATNPANTVFGEFLVLCFCCLFYECNSVSLQRKIRIFFFLSFLILVWFHSW